MTTHTLDVLPGVPLHVLKPRFSAIYDFWPAAERPPVLNDMMPDIERLIHSVALRFTDKTCAHLHYDEMVGECRFKLAEIIDRGELQRQPTRGNFFKFFKTALQNQARSRVQKYRFTEKRTGFKPPPRDQRTYTVGPDDDDCHHEGTVVVPEHHKNVEISLDDEDANVQVTSSAALDDVEFQQVVQEYEVILTEVERMVFRQMAMPNQMSYLYAFQDACHGKTSAKIQVKIKNVHLALGLGITVELFEEAVLSIRQRVHAYRTMNDAERIQQSRYNATLATLKELFGLQIPPGTDDILVRRLFTIAARDQYSKVDGNPQAQEMLEMIGAKVPRLHADGQLACYGVLYQKNHRHCNHCGLRQSCSVEAANVGLGKIALSPRLLGARQTRVPVVLPVDSDSAGSQDEADVVGYLDESFMAAPRRDGIYYTLKDCAKPVFLLCLENPFRLRFCNPSTSLRERLHGPKRNYPPPTATVQDIIALVDQHAKESLESVVRPA